MTVAGTIKVTPIRAGGVEGTITGYNITIPSLRKGTHIYKILATQTTIYSATVQEEGDPGNFNLQDLTVEITFPDESRAPFPRPH